jgi:hypothetical protein
MRRGRSPFFWAVAASAVALVLAAVGALAFRGLQGGLATRTIIGDRDLNGATATTVTGNTVWVVNSTSSGEGSVTELNARDGRRIRTLSGARYGLRYPTAIAADGTHIWVANDPQTGSGQSPKAGDGSVTEVNAADGALVHILSGPRYAFNFPSAVTVAGGHVWVANYWGDSVTELNAGDGSWIRTISGGRYRFSGPSAMTAVGVHLWIANAGENESSGSVTELNTADGSWIRTLSDARYGFSEPSSIIAAGSRIWITNSHPTGNGGSVTELNARDGSLVRILTDGCYSFDSPSDIVATGSHIWVANSNRDQTGGSVTEMNVGDGTWARTLRSSAGIWPMLHGCIFGAFGNGNYRFSNPSVLAAVGSHIWIFDGNGSITVLADPGHSKASR